MTATILNFPLKAQAQVALVVEAPALRDQGSRFEDTKDLDVKEIAKLMRQDISALKKKGALPKGLKVSVKIQRYSGGQSIDFLIRGNLGSPIYNLEWLEHESRSLGDIFEGHRYTPEALEALEALKSVHTDYNYDESDSRVDYYDVKYYGGVGFCQTLLSEDQDQQLGEK